MRAARLLHMLLLLQNRGRLTSSQLAQELEVAPRTILRDVDAMTEAGLPIVVHQGNQGGIELAFNYRTRLTGLSHAEAEALAIMLDVNHPMLAGLELQSAAKMASNKLFESMPDKVRQVMRQTDERFHRSHAELPEPDERVPAMADAVRGRHFVQLYADQAQRRTIEPVRLTLSSASWSVLDQISSREIEMEGWGTIAISAKSFGLREPGIFS
ncbi:MAG: HTH domain-containing protein [Pseudomonadota bacterium]